MRYIYESPDKGKTVYRKPYNNRTAERELVPLDDFFVEMNDEGTMIILEVGVGFQGFIREV